MNMPIRSLVWKEACEARWVMYAGILVLIAFPIVTTAQLYLRWAEGWYVKPMLAEAALIMGGVFVVLAAITVASRDFRNGESAHWRVLPVRPLPFTAVKFLSGLFASVGVVVIAMMIHLAMAAWVGFEAEWFGANSNSYALRPALHQLSSHIFLLTALYAVTFAITSASRHVMTAVFLSAIAAALLYCLPLVVPSLEAVNLWRLLDKPPMWLFPSQEAARYFSGSSTLHVPGASLWIVYSKMLPPFVVAMLGLTAVAAGVSWLIVRSNLALRLDGWRVAWVMVAIGLGLFAAAGTQVGSNLEPVAITPVSGEGDRAVLDLKCDGEHGMAVVIAGTTTRYVAQRPMTFQRFDPKTLSLIEGKTYELSQTASAHYGLYGNVCEWAWSPKHPDVVYWIDKQWTNGQSPKLQRVMLCTIDFDTPTGPIVTNRIDLMPPTEDKRIISANLHLMDDTLYVLTRHIGDAQSTIQGSALTCYDLAEPRIPQVQRVLSGNRLNLTGAPFHASSGSNNIMNLPAIDGLTWRQRFELHTALSHDYQLAAITPQRAVWYTNERLLVMDTHTSGGDRLQYDFAGERRETPLEALMGYHFTDALLDGDLLYLVSSSNGMMVFDIAAPRAAVKVGHYITAADRLQRVVKLPDGRVAAVGWMTHVFDLK